ncbi:MAG: hypothetical protein Q9157_000199 [Trypethelium eluteriae]
MVGQQYQDVCSILKQSFQSQSFSSRPTDLAGKAVMLSEGRKSSSSSDFSSAPDRFLTPRPLEQVCQQSDVSMLRPPAQPGFGLPPTPPSNTQESSADSRNSASTYADGVVGSLMSQKSGLSTPINQRSPPTPETTPPHNLEYLSVSRPSLVSHTPSSFAGSFRTAQENQSIEDGESCQYAPSEASTRSPSGAWSHSAGRRPGRPVPEIGLGLNFEYMAGEQSSVESTPAERYPDIERQEEQQIENVESVKIDRNTEQSRNEYAQALEWDDDRMRNVTLRKRQPRIALPPSAKPDQSIAKNISPSLRPELKEPGAFNKHSGRSLNMQKAVRDGEGSSMVRGPAQAQIHREEQKRLSSASNISSVVEAMVVPSPTACRPHHRTLKRMGKNVSLREGDRSFTSHSTSASQVSEDGPLRPFGHKRSPISDRKNRNSDGSNVSSRDSSSPRRLRPRPDSAPDLAFPQPPSDPGLRTQHLTSVQSAGERVKQLPAGLDRVGLGYFDIARQRAIFAHDAPRKNESRPRHSLPGSKVSDTTNHALLIHDPAAASPNPAARDLSQEHLSIPDVVRQFPMPKSSRKGWQRDDLDEDLLSDEPALPIMGARLDSKASADGGMRSTSLENSSSLQAQFEPPRSSRETTSIPRSSADRLLAPNSDHSLARYAHASASPHSEGSTEQPDTLEVSQATAVSIYPHTNHSLLVVQQLARPTTSGGVIERRRTISSIRSGSSASHSRLQSQPVPLFTTTISPSTPPMDALATSGQNGFSVSTLSSRHLSPLKTSHVASQPPAFKIIPPTPLSEIDSPLSLGNTNAATKVAQLAGPGVPTIASHNVQKVPARRLSLRQRARRISEPIIQPLLQAKAQLPLPGNKNRYNLHAHPPSVPSVSDMPQEDNKLHPFWRPRGFWDDFSDSEDSEDSCDDDEEEEEEEEELGFFVAGRHATGHGHASYPLDSFDPDLDRLSEGGDTSNVKPLFPTGKSPLRLSGGSLSRRISSLRSGVAGRGSFLIGNSLGIGRQPSNSRRHVVNLPSSLRARLAIPNGVQKRRSQGACSVAEGSLRSASVGRARGQKGLVYRAKAGVKNTRSTLDGILAGRGRLGGEETDNLGFKVSGGLERVRDRLTVLRKERRRRALKKSIGKVEMIDDRRTSSL